MAVASSGAARCFGLVVLARMHQHLSRHAAPLPTPPHLCCPSSGAHVLPGRCSYDVTTTCKSGRSLKIKCQGECRLGRMPAVHRICVCVLRAAAATLRADANVAGLTHAVLCCVVLCCAVLQCIPSAASAWWAAAP